ncbi:MAG: hypothetical protein IT303_01105 [Dehalococcoidia bacterium]|nr:hypothetical protein [Dehalococcoidia bacterium]
MVAIAALFALATVLTWRPLRAAIPAESLLAVVGVGAIFAVLLALGQAG